MSKLHKEWRLLPEQPDLRERLSAKLNVSEIISQVLINRGIQDEAVAQEFLYGGRDHLGDSFLLKDMKKAVERIIAAKENKEKIVIYGDYDVDGVTATALVYTTLLRIGVDKELLTYYIPEREKEGYGLNGTALDRLCLAGFSLVITVDCGISAVSEVKDAPSMDFIITDHHQPPETLPAAFAIINPKQVDCFYKDKNLAGVGVAFKLCQALSQQLFGSDEAVFDLLDYVAIGTVADIVSLTGENRILVKNGLSELAVTKKIGLIKLLEECKLVQEKLDAGKIGFIIAPRLNAAGRVGKADTGVELLVTVDEERASYLAGFLEQENQKRQELEKKILLMAEETLLANGWEQEGVFVLAGEDWHPGVIGIVASRLVEKYYRPVVMISIKEGIGKGSCRSIVGFDIYEALKDCSDLLLKYGGHRQAAGLSINPENILKFRERLNKVAEAKLTEADYQPILRIDSMVALEKIDTAFLEQLACLAPHGMGNPAPVFACRDLRLDDVRKIGQEGRHLKLRVRLRSGVKEILAWQMGELAESIQPQALVDVAFVPEFNEWQGRRSIQFRAHDIMVPKVPLNKEELFCTFAIKNVYQDGIVLKDVKYALSSPFDIDGAVRHNLLLKDMRTAGDKLDYLAACLDSGEKTIVYVNTHFEAFQLFTSLGELVPELKKRMGIYSGCLSSECLSLVTEWFSKKRLSVIIATGLFCREQKEHNVSQVIFWGAPINGELFKRQCLGAHTNTNGVTGIIQLLFGRENVAAVLSSMTRDLPDRILIGYFYLILKECMAGRTAIVLTNEELAERLSAKYHTALSAYGVECALTILEELQLVRQQLTGSVRRIYLLPQPEKKLDINSSPSFLQGQQEKKDFQQFAETILSATREEILTLVLQSN